MNKSASIVIDTGFGDAGKGMVTNTICQQSNSSDTIAIRFSGGHQAGHTVMLPGGLTHIHSSFPSGTLSGYRGYLTEHCIVYPPGMMREFDILTAKRRGFTPNLVVHPHAIITTPFDIVSGQNRERSLNHGSCGVGIGATMMRHSGRHRIHAIDLFSPFILKQKLFAIQTEYRELGHVVLDDELESYMEFCERFTDSIDVYEYDYLSKFSNLVFEGSQGVLLDKDHGTFPHVTYGNTTSKNALDCIRQLPIELSNIDIYYVTRCYQTRHGTGPMTDERNLPLINNSMEINVTKEWQGAFRTGLFDPSLVEHSIRVDKSYHSQYCKLIQYYMVITCVDQLERYPYIGDEKNDSFDGLIDSVRGYTDKIFTSSNPYPNFDNNGQHYN